MAKETHLLLHTAAIDNYHRCSGKDSKNKWNKRWITIKTKTKKVDLKMAQAGNDRGWEEEQKKRDAEDHWLELLQVPILRTSNLLVPIPRTSNLLVRILRTANLLVPIPRNPNPLA